MEVNEHEYRFKNVIDLDTREVLFTVEHEVRSQTHPLYGRPLINRNPAQSNATTSPATTACPGPCPSRHARTCSDLLRASTSSSLGNKKDVDGHGKPGRDAVESDACVPKHIEGTAWPRDAPW